jgi:hypothetical protein
MKPERIAELRSLTNDDLPMSEVMELLLDAYEALAAERQGEGARNERDRTEGMEEVLSSRGHGRTCRRETEAPQREGQGAQRMSLRERAEVAFAEITKCTCIDDYKLRGRTDPTCIACEIGGEVKDAIKRECRAFAERALRHLAVKHLCEEDRLHAWQDDFAEAIKAAEEGDE